jgi:hypothetical protein
MPPTVGDKWMRQASCHMRLAALASRKRRPHWVRHHLKWAGKAIGHAIGRAES